MTRNIIILMYLVTFVPLLSMAGINYFQYHASLKKEIVGSLRLMSHKAAHSISLFIEERLSSIRALAASYSYRQLSDQEVLNGLYRIFKKEFGGFVDLGVINKDGIQVAYAGPYDLLGKKYSQQKWFNEVSIRSVYVSDVFMGHRGFPHIAIAVQQFDSRGQAWFLRATIDTKKFDEIITAMGIIPECDAFLTNRKNVLQTQSRFFGNVLERYPLSVPSSAPGTYVLEEKDEQGHDVLISYTNFPQNDFSLVVVKPRSIVLKTWYALEKEMLLAFLIGTALIIIAVIKTANYLVKTIKSADEKRESAFRELENSQKLSSIGRLAAGVAHEINNPLAIINQKSGLMKDLIEFDAIFEERDKFLKLTDSILKSVERCKKITHRLLGFARRMEVMYEKLDLNETIVEVLGFLEKEALYREVKLELRLSDEIPKISSDMGQLQQVFLNIFSNSFAAVEDGGNITVTSWKKNDEMVAVSIEDDGCGMSEETLTHIFEPFFTTKKDYGTGLGLPITYGIVEKLGGKIEVKSVENEGTVFTVELKINKFEKEEIQ
ncbi:MAG: two-component sensor histidine kinase [Proteobacteria bacterium]|nr:two-component sensor histidine kinase [Pseudomonadota bacterium]